MLCSSPRSNMAQYSILLVVLLLLMTAMFRPATVRATVEPECVQLSLSLRHQLQKALTKVCPLFSAVYNESSGVGVVGGAIDSDGDFHRYVADLLVRYDRQLAAFSLSKLSVAESIAKLQWKGPNASQVLYQLEVLLCTSLFPICTSRFVQQRVTGDTGKHVLNSSGSSGSSTTSSQTANPISGATSKSTTSSIALSALNQTLSSLQVLRPCRWICEDLRAFLGLISQLASRGIKDSIWIGFLSRVLDTCGHNTSIPGQYVHCLNFSGFYSGAVEELYPDIQGDYIVGEGLNHTLSLRVITSKKRTYSPPRTLCFSLALTNRTKEYFVATSDSRHWDRRVQGVLAEITKAARKLVNATEEQMPVNGSLMPYALGCRSVVFSVAAISRVRQVMLVLTQITFVAVLFALASFLIQWRRMKKYPMPVLLYLNASALMTTIGFSIRFYLPDDNRLICHSDGSILLDQPRSNDESGWCVTQFILSYYFLIATCFWWTCFAHSWYVTFTQLANRSTSVMKGLVLKEQHHTMLVYHLVSWLPGIVLLVPILAKRYVWGLPIYGVCWLSGYKPYIGFLVVPQTISLLAGFGFLVAGMRSLWKARQYVSKMWSSGKIVVPEGKRRNAMTNTHRYLAQMPVYITLTLLLVAMQVGMSAYEASNMEWWVRQTTDRLTCLQFSCNGGADCPEEIKDDGTIYLVKVIFLIFCSWMCCSWAILSRETWARWAQVLRISSVSTLLSQGAPTGSSTSGKDKTVRTKLELSAQYTGDSCTAPKNGSSVHQPESSTDTETSILHGHKHLSPSESIETGA
eukprot:scpid26366/ scgid21427/ Smoothened homolog